MNLVIPRPNPNGVKVSGVGKVSYILVSSFSNADLSSFPIDNCWFFLYVQVFLEYADTESSTKARAGLYGRKFDENQVVVSFYSENKFKQGDYDG